MNLTELPALGAPALPVRALAEHLRLGSGFADDGAQDGLLDALLNAAIAAIEARTGKILLQKDFSWEVTYWFDPERQGLPVGPVSRISAVFAVDRNGGETQVDADRYRLQPDLFRPALIGSPLPQVPGGGLMRIFFTAGFGPAWEDIPADLRQALLMLAAHFYEDRSGAGGETGVPFAVQALIEKYRTLRVFGAGR